MWAQLRGKCGSLGNDGRSLVRVNTFSAAGIHCRGHVVVSRSVLNVAVHVAHSSDQPAVDLAVAGSTDRAPIDVVAGDS